MHFSAERIRELLDASAFVYSEESQHTLKCESCNKLFLEVFDRWAKDRICHMETVSTDVLERVVKRRQVLVGLSMLGGRRHAWKLLRFAVSK